MSESDQTEAPLLETIRLRLSPFREEHLRGLLEVYASNAAYRALTGEDAEGMLEEDLKDVQRVGSTLAGLWGREDGQAAGVVSFLDRNPNDGSPWLGLLMMHRKLHGQGYGVEAMDGLLRYFREARGWKRVRLGVILQNEKARRFWERQGFRAYGSEVKPFPVGHVPVLLMERAL